MKKYKIMLATSVFLSSTIITASSFASKEEEVVTKHDFRGFYIGGSFDTVYAGGHRNDTSTLLTSTVILIDSKERLGLGGSLFAGWTFQSGVLALSPEISIQANSAKNKTSSTAALSKTELSRKYALSLSLLPSVDLYENFSLQGLISVNYARFQYKTEEIDSSPAPANKSFNNVGFSLGIGAEQRFEYLSAGLMLSHTIYQSKKTSVTNSEGNTFENNKIPGYTQLSLRVKIPFSL